LARILVVDDDAQVRRLLTRALNGEGHAVMTVSDGTKGIRYFSMMEPDVLILDLAMPGTDGFKVLRAIREDVRRTNTSVIVLSGQSSDAHIVRSYELGATHYICKPFVTEEIVEGVAQALSLRSNQSRITSNL
jgi:DNA-binding response OmpR family regulator